jgi:Tetracyclin repressor-like, C-terminal domain
MTPTIVLPDGDPHMAALLARPDFAARLDRLGGARLHADLPANDDELIARIGDATVVILGARGELAADADLDMLVDMAYGVIYYRLLVGHAPLDRTAARSLAAELAR